MNEPIEIEMCGEGGDDAYERQWMVEPPATGAGFVVIRSEWDDDNRVVKVWEWKAA